MGRYGKIICLKVPSKKVNDDLLRIPGGSSFQSEGYYLTLSRSLTLSHTLTLSQDNVRVTIDLRRTWSNL